MKILKTASGKQKLKISKKEWESIGKKAGWMKEAVELPGEKRKCSNPYCEKEVGNDEKTCPSCHTENLNYWPLYGE